MSEVEQEYRDALAGDYLRVDYGSLATIKTTSGIVYASAIVKSLDPLGPDWRSKYPDHFTDSVFTIDENGNVVGYGLYSGFDVVALNRAIGQSIAGHESCARAKGLFLKDSQLPSFLRDYLNQNNLQDH
ncbi:MAG TPA: hypothetical protein VHY19_07420 [Steroidobacteraceae bacterium]|nr:hypothetical protein [Steroidobacteraceae bacterium]